jgi:trans-aconitate methyltransferase
MDPEYAGNYGELYAGHWWWRAREAFILDALGRRLTGGAAGRRILDVGCGDGLLFEQLSRFGEVEGIEPDPSCVTPGGPWSSRITMQAFDETFQPGHRYDQILLLDVLEHVEDAAAMLRRSIELLEPHGFVLVTVPAFPALWTSHDELNRHYTRYTRSSLEKLARGCGARIETSRYFFHWLVAAKLAVRLKESVAGAEPSTPAIPPRWLNLALARLSRLEQVTVSRLPVPFGTSLLAVLVDAGRTSP